MDSVAFWPSFLKMLFALALVLGLLIGAMHFFQRILQKTSPSANDNVAISVVASRYLGPKSSIMLVEVLGNLIVIGIANNQMSHLATISDPEALEKVKHLGGQGGKKPPLADYVMKQKIVQSLRNCWGKEGRRV